MPLGGERKRFVLTPRTMRAGPREARHQIARFTVGKAHHQHFDRGRAADRFRSVVDAARHVFERLPYSATAASAGFSWPGITMASRGIW